MMDLLASELTYKFCMFWFKHERGWIVFFLVSDMKYSVTIQYFYTWKASVRRRLSVTLCMEELEHADSKEHLGNSRYLVQHPKSC